MAYTYTFNAYHIGSAGPLNKSQLAQLTGHFGPPAYNGNGVLSGRHAVKRLDLQKVGKVVVKQFARGGMLRHINRSTYIKSGKTRAQAEFELLAKLRGLGVNAPEPVAYAFCGRFFYHAWLITREIEAVESLAEVALKDPKRAHQLLDPVTGQIRRLIENQIHHVDMHPGNVLVGLDDEIYLIDFDKAKISRLSSEKLAAKYCRRWHRAVIKHHLPDVLDTAFQGQLCEGEGCRV